MSRQVFFSLSVSSSFCGSICTWCSRYVSQMMSGFHFYFLFFSLLFRYLFFQLILSRLPAELCQLVSGLVRTADFQKHFHDHKQHTCAHFQMFHSFRLPLSQTMDDMNFQFQFTVSRFAFQIQTSRSRKFFSQNVLSRQRVSLDKFAQQTDQPAQPYPVLSSPTHPSHSSN